MFVAIYLISTSSVNFTVLTLFAQCAVVSSLINAQ